MPDADVSISRTGGGPNQLSTKSDGSGHYTLSLLAGTVTVAAQSPGYSDDVRDLALTRDQVLDLELMGSVALNAGESVDAELHVGPHNGICHGFLENEFEPCRTFIVRFDRAGTLSVRLNWPGGDGLALAQRVYLVADIPGFRHETCCRSGETLHLATTGPGESTLVVRLRDRQIAPVKFTLSTSIS